MRNYSIFLNEREGLLFAYFEYFGLDYEADMRVIAANPVMDKWRLECGVLQEPLDHRSEGEWWAAMEEVFHIT